MSKSVSAARYTYRFVSGLELDGHRRTDATWRMPGRDLRHGVHHAWAWHYLPRSQRAMWRVGLVSLSLFLTWASWVAPAQTLLSLEGLGVLGFCVFAHWLWGKFQGFAKHHRWTGPLSVVLGDRWGVDPAVLLAGITIPDDCRTNADHPAVVTLPEAYRETDRQAEESAKMVARKVRIPVTAMDHDIQWEGDRPKMLVRAMEVPPETVLFADVREALNRSGDGHYFLGLGLRGAEVWADLNGDGPHWAWSCGTGAGKSTAARNVAAQVRREGGRVVILDAAKEGDSHSDWIYDERGQLLPDIEHYTDVGSAHDALVRLGDERRRRARLAREAKQFRRPEPVFQRTLVIFEEQNAAYDLLADHWKVLRKALKAETGEDQPDQSPAMTATKSLVYAGRSARMHCFVSAQRFDAKILGGGDVRGNFMVRMLSRFDEGARRMLIPDILPKPLSSNHLGRSIVCMGGVATPFQGVWMTPDEARDWSSEGRPMVSHAATETPVSPAQTAQTQSEVVSETPSRTPLRLVEPLAPEPAPTEEWVTLTEAVEQNIVSASLDAVRRASCRDGFPAPQGKRGNAKTYAAWELAEWGARRPAMAGSSGGDAS